MPTTEEVPQKNRRPGLFDFLFGHFMQTVFEIVLSLFFSRMEILGSENFPRYGPAIVVGNHNNQFADGILLASKCYGQGRDVRFIIAEKSWHRPIIGHLAKAIKCIPVARPQDNAKTGAGKLSGTEGQTKITGEGTAFTSSLRPGDSIKAGAGTYRIDSVVSDTELVLKDTLTESLGAVGYKIFKRIDQNKMYRNVYDLFLDGGLLGIFPEGGSHDRTEMLPLKAGVCIMALSTMQQYPQMDVKIVPCGFNYMSGHKFRSKVVLQFGPPIEISRELVEMYTTDKHQAIATLLEQITASMKDVVVEAPDYDALRVIHMLRRLYVPLGRRLNPKEYHIINKRISMVYKGADQVKGFQELAQEVQDYRQKLDDYHITDAQVARMQAATLSGPKRNAAILLIQRIFSLLAASVVAAPGMILASPIGIVGERIAAQKAKEALAGSDVKIKALDVIASWKLITILIMVPLLVLVYTSAFCLGLFLFTELSAVKIVVLTLAFAIVLPYYGNMSLKMFDNIVRGIRTLKPLYLRATGAFQHRGSELVVLRAGLQAKVRAMIEEEGPKHLSEFENVRLIRPEEFEREAELLRVVAESQREEEKAEGEASQ